jgi:hypothetical protein
MADDASRPGPNPRWKSGAASPKGGSPRYAWKSQGPESAAGRTSWWVRQSLFVFGGVVCLALIGGLIWLLRSPPHAGLVLVGADPAEDVERLDVPLDVSGWEGGRQLAAWAEEVSKNHKSRWGKLAPDVLGADPLTPVSLHADQFDAWADDLAGKKRDPLVVVFGLHGGAGGDGPFLFTAGGGRLPLRAVIAKFADDRFRNRQVVLVLDPARLSPDPTLGLLQADCVGALVALETRESLIQNAASKLVVLCASSPGQRGWDSEEWRCGAFTRDLIDGLRGRAAPAGKDAVTAWDLFAYAKQQTEAWTAANRPAGQKQTPLLLPSGPDGEARARSIAVAVRVGDAAPADPATAPGATFRAPEELLANWRRWEALDRSVPSPAVYTPRLWRRYRQLLLRYEQLVRADERPAAAKLTRALTAVSQELEDGIVLRRGAVSAANALPLSAAYGLAAATAWPDADEQAFRKLWAARAKPEDRDPLWEKLKTDAGAAVGLLRLRLNAFLLAKAGDPNGAPEDTAEAANLLAFVYAKDPGAVRPGEAHYMLMVRAFDRDFDWAGPKPAAELRKAMAVRLNADRAAMGTPTDGSYPYGEQVWPGVRAVVEKADVNRRAGEDLLFAGESRRAEARTKLAEADELYANALNVSRVVREGLAARDRALADLPFLTRWLAAQRLDDARVRDLEGLWAKVHALDTTLADAARQPDRAAQMIDRLAAATRDVQGPFQEVVDRFHEQCRAAADFSVLQQNWLGIEQALAVPMIEPARRMRLVERSREMSGKFNTERTGTAEDTGVAAAEKPGDQARREGRLALAVLGAAPTGAVADNDLPSPEVIRGLLAADGGREGDLNRAGDLVARRWQALAKAAENGNPAVAERPSRSAVAFAPPDGPDPALLLRRQRWQQVLVGLARRTALDHWYAENGDAYFRRAAERFLTDAAELVAAGPDGRKAEPAGAADVKDLLKTPPLEMKAPERLDITSETSVTLDYAVTAAPALAGNGYVTLWPQMPAGVLSARAEDRARVPVDVGAARRQVQLDASSASAPAVKVTLQGYYRGQTPRAETTVSLDRSPVRIVSRFAPPEKAGFAGRADPSFHGAVAIVLDYSGSMGERPDGTNDWKKPDSKFQQMMTVLPRVLADVPAGTHLSVRLYGHKPMPSVAGAPPVTSSQDVLNRFWTPQTPTERVFSGTWGPKDSGMSDQLMTQLRSYPPQGYTPLVHSMKEAKAQDFPKGFVGPRTLLVLTDGADTWYGSDPTKLAKREFEEAFRDSDVSVQIIVFKATAGEERIAQEQFREVVNFPTPGTIELANNAAALTDVLRTALRPKIRLLTLSGGPALPKLSHGVPANKADDPLNRLIPSPPIDAGTYRAAVFGSRQLVGFARGDRLLIRLFNAAEGVRFERDLLARELRDDRRRREGDWVLGVHQVRDDVTPQVRRLRLMTTLETTKDVSPGPEGELKQTPPAAQWWDVTPAGQDDGKSLGQLRIHPLYGYPAPAWDIAVDDWPVGRPVRLTAWCRPDPPPVAKKVPVVLGGGEQTVVLDDGRKLALAADVQRYPLYTGVGPNLARPAAIPCLVVRVREGAPGQSVQVQLADVPGVPRLSEDHRYYKSGNYTAAFGPLAREQVEGKAVEVQLVTVDALKAKDTTRISIDLPPPAPDDPRPEPIKLAGDTAGP